MTVFVLWENHSDESIERFGPHVFLVACVAHRLGLDQFALRRSRVIGGRSCGGNGRVLALLEPGPAWDVARHLIAVLDTDRLHDRLGGDPRRRVNDYDAWARQMDARCRERIGTHDAERLSVHFLDENLESLLRIVGDDASKKDVVQRDKVLKRAAASPALIERAAAQMPTWGALVETVAQRIA